VALCIAAQRIEWQKALSACVVISVMVKDAQNSSTLPALDK
jgi:hypothetical protein